MPDIIPSWLGRKLGVLVDMSPDNFGRNMKDGKLLAKLLYSYGIITLEILDSIKSAKYINECYNNLIILKPWLEFLEVPNLDSILKDLANGNGSAAVQLFYALYLNLENKDRLRFLSDQKGKKFLRQSLKREVKVDWVPEMEIRERTVQYENDLALPLIEKNEMIKWHKENCLDVLEEIKKVKKKFAETVNNPQINVKFNQVKKPLSKRLAEINETRQNINCLEQKYYQKTQDLNYEELMELKGKVESLPPVVPNSNEAKNYVNFIKQRSKRNMSERMFQQRMSTMMAEEMLKNLIEKQEIEFDDKVIRNLLKQSQYEKQMCSKLFLIRHQKKVLAENRSMVEKLILNEREKEFIEVLNRRLDSKSEEAGEDFFEKERIRELHRRMYGEKAKLKAEGDIKECQSILNSLIDISIRCAEYREEHDCFVPKHLMKDMKELFFKDLPVFDILEDVEKLHEKGGSDDSCDLILGLEEERQSVLDDCDLNDYLHLLGPWMVELLSPEEESGEVEPFVLGYIVYKLLEVKYPMPVVPVPADIKPMYPRSVVRDLNDEKAKEMLLDLLNLKKILLVNVEDAVNFVLGVYKEELSVVRDIDINFQKATKASLKDKEPDKAKKSKKEELLKKETTKKDATPSVEALIKEQETQTPRRIPEDDPELSPNAEIGKMAFEYLGLGETVPDTVIVPSIVAYVVAKQNEYDGWVLLNYPLTYSQASKLETALTGVKLPPLEDEQGKGHHRRSSCKDIQSLDVYGPLRISRLVPNPIKPESYAPPKTYFSSFIKIQKKAPEDVKNALENFYSQQNIFQEFEYAAVNFQWVKDLGKNILGESQRQISEDEDAEVLPPKTSLEIFGNELVELNEKYATKGKESKKASPKVTTEIKSGSIVKSKSLIKEPSVESKDKKSEKKEVPKPGDPDYPWITPTQPEEILSALADFWQNMETIYVEDFKQIFFCLRVHYSKVTMYSTFVKNLLRTFMRRPDDKASLINEFQLMYNNVDQDLRPEVDVKCELHSRVHKFESTLLEMADQRKFISEEERKKIINDLWVCDEMSCLINYYIIAMQLECDRCIDTCQIINDYYLTLQQKSPEEKTLPKILIPRLQISGRKYSIISEASGKSSRSAASKRRKSSENAFLVNGTEAIVTILTDLTLLEENPTPFHLFLTENLDRATKEVSAVVENLTAQSKKAEKPKDKKKPEDKSLDVGNQIATEWTAALEDELKRFSFRSKIIKIRGLLDIDEFISTMYETFLLLSDEIGETYAKEVQSILNCCKVFRCAIEEEIPIPYQLELVIDEFIVNKEVIFFEPEKEPSVKSLDEKPSEVGFSMEQLFNLYEKLKRVAPNGEIIRRSFIYILEDLRVMKSEDDTIKAMPNVWDLIAPDDFSAIFDKIYQKLEIVNWKDFIIYALDLPFPTEAEILWMRDQFRQFDYECENFVQIDDYKKIDFWFVLNRGGDYRTSKAKELLFYLFGINENFVNYHSLLLAFCKDEDPAVGFAKALALACGKKIIIRNFNPETGDPEPEEEKLEMANNILSEVVADVLQETEGIILKEIREEESKIFSEGPKSSVSSSFGETEGECYDAFKESETATSVVTSDIVSAVILSAYPSLPKLSILLNCERTLEESLKIVYESLANVDEKFQVYNLLQHDFIYRLLTGTNKFKIIPFGLILNEITRRNSNHSV